MNRRELRAGVIRLALVALVAFAVPAIIGLVVWVRRGGDLEETVAWSLSLAALVPLLAGVFVYLTSRPVTRERGTDGVKVVRRRTPQELRERELLCGGLLLLGTAMFAVELLLR